MGSARLAHYRSLICQPTASSVHPQLEVEDFGESCSPSFTDKDAELLR